MESETKPRCEQTDGLAPDFEFSLGERVRLAPPETVGEVIGRAHFSNRKSEYLVRYMGGHGQVEIWFAAEALRAA